MLGTILAFWIVDSMLFYIKRYPNLQKILMSKGDPLRVERVKKKPLHPKSALSDFTLSNAK